VIPPIAVPTGESPLLRALPRGSPRGARRPVSLRQKDRMEGGREVERWRKGMEMVQKWGRERGMR
jgi:hypothetical protein